MHRIILGWTVLFAAGFALADPIKPADVAPGAKWIAHLDARALLASEGGQHILTIARQEHNLDQKMQEFAAAFGFDPTKDLAGVTAYGTDFEPASGVAVFRGTFNQEKLLALLDQNAGHATSAYGEYTLHRWTEPPKGRGDDGVRYGAFHKSGPVVIGRSVPAVQNALDVLDGKITGTPDALPPVAAGTFLFATAKDLPTTSPDGRHAQLLKKVSGGLIEIGENQGTLFVSVKLNARKPEDAKRTRQMLSGIVAFLSMSLDQAEESGQPRPYWAPLVDGAEVTGDDASVKLSISVKTQTLIEIGKADAAAKQAATQN